MATFFDLQEKNRKKTRIIVVCFVLFFIWLGLGLDLALYFWGGGSIRSHSYGYRYRHHYTSSLPATLPVKKKKHFRPVFTLVVGLAGVGLAWWSMCHAAGTVLGAVLARPADRGHSPEEQTLVNVVEEMCIASSMTTPKVWIIPDTDPNAMAVGLKEGDYHIAVTEGLLRSLNRSEIQGVVAHEIAHLKNQDTRLMTALTVLVGLAALISEFVGRTRLLGMGSSGGDSDDRKIGGIIFALWLLSVIVAPFVTQLMALMVSREREYLADASAAQFTRNPEALANALGKIAAAVSPTALVKPASAHLCIASPTAADVGSAVKCSWFATHPPMRMRIHRLMTIGRSLQERAALA